MRYSYACILLFTPTLVGCHSMTSRADPNWEADLKRADAVVVRNLTAEQRLTDPDVIDRLARIYRGAKWEPYWHTLPGNLGDRTIDVFLGEAKLRHLSYTGVLWENERYDSNRTASLTDSDREWLESLFDSIANEGAR